MSKETIENNINLNTLKNQALKNYIKLDKYIEIIKDVKDYKEDNNKEIFNIDKEKNEESSFRKNYTQYYDMHFRSKAWRNNFYEYFEDIIKKKKCNKIDLLEDIITTLSSFSEDKEQLEFSFATKLLATIYPNEPTIDSNVLKKFEKEINKEKKLITKGSFRVVGKDFEERKNNAIKVFEKVKEIEEQLLENEKVQKEIEKFKENFKKELDDSDLTDMKILDFFLWKQNIDISSKK